MQWCNPFFNEEVKKPGLAGFGKRPGLFYFLDPPPRNCVFFIHTPKWMIHICFSTISMRRTKWWGSLYILTKCQNRLISQFGKLVKPVFVENFGFSFSYTLLAVNKYIVYTIIQCIYAKMLKQNYCMRTWYIGNNIFGRQDAWSPPNKWTKAKTGLVLASDENWS